MASEFKATRRVEFSDTDLAGIMHFSNFFRFMETAEHGFFRSLGFAIHDAETGIGWPRVHAECDYARPLRFEDEVEVHLRVKEVREKAIAYEFTFRKLNARPAEEVARGAVVVACVRRDKDGRLKAIRIPKSVAMRIEAIK